MGRDNTITHYGKPLVGIILGWAGLFGLLLAVGGEAFRSQWAVWIVVLYVHWSAISYLVWLAHDFKADALTSPKIKAIRSAEGVVLVQKKDWLGINVQVIIYRLDGDYERFVCQGSVVNIQGNGIIQILVLIDSNDDRSLIFSKLSEGNVRDLIIKPGTNAVI